MAMQRLVGFTSQHNEAIVEVDEEEDTSETGSARGAAAKPAAAKPLADANNTKPKSTASSAQTQSKPVSRNNESGLDNSARRSMERELLLDAESTSYCNGGIQMNILGSSDDAVNDEKATTTTTKPKLSHQRFPSINCSPCAASNRNWFANNRSVSTDIPGRGVIEPAALSRPGSHSGPLERINSFDRGTQTHRTSKKLLSLSKYCVISTHHIGISAAVVIYCG